MCQKSLSVCGVLSLCIGVCVGVAAERQALAASINWGPAFELVTVADLDLSKPFILAANGGNDAGVTVGGVTFDNYTSPEFGAFTSEPTWITSVTSGGVLNSFSSSALDVYTTTTGDAGLDTILATHTFNIPNVAPVTHTISGLTIGQTYQVQVVGQADDRGVCCDDFVTLVDGGDGAGGVTIHRFIDLNGDSVRHVTTSIGTFVADATTQQFITDGQNSAGGANEGHGGFAALIVSSDQPFGAADVVANIDRTTGGISLTNMASFGTANILGYSLTSNAGSFDQSGWKSIAENYDADGPNTADGGALIGTVDADDKWTVLSAVGDNTDLSEGELDGGNGGLIAPGQTVDLGTPWRRTPFEDVTAELLFSDGTIRTIPVNYTGAPIVPGDLDGNGVIDALDWAAFKSGQGTNFAGMDPAVSYQLGNLLPDNAHDLRDFALFKQAFDAANGAGALSALIARVPEPSSWLLFALAGAACCVCRWRRASGSVSLLTALVLGMFALPTSAPAASINWGPAFELISVADLDLTGANILAANGGNNAGVVVSGVTFDSYTSPPFAAITGEPAWITSVTTDGELRSFSQADIPGVGVYATTTGNAGLDTILDSHTFNFGPLALVTHTLQNLIVGQTYQVQIVGQADDRGVCCDDYVTNVDGGDSGGGVTIHRFVDLDGDNVKHVSTAIGTFTADATTQSFTTIGQTLNGNPDAPASEWEGHGGFAALVLSEVDTGVITRLSLEVNTATGNIQLTNQTGGAIEFDSYQIRSPGESPNFTGSLNPNGWNSIAERNTPISGFPQGDGTGDGWEVGPNVSANELVEWFLDDTDNESSLASGGSINLGTAYNTAVDGQDLEFLYRLTNGSLVVGLVDYVSTPAINGDYNGDGIVDAADYTVWRDTLGSTTDLRADGSGNGTVGPEDYQFWKDRFGTTTGSGNLTAAAVPEPATTALALLGLAGAFCLAVRPRFNRHLFATCTGRVVIFAAGAVGVAWAAVGSTAQAAVTNDRVYSFGEDSLEGASQGAIIGSNNSGGLPSGDTADSTGPTGAFLDLTQSGGPTYQNVGPGPSGLARPGVVGTEYGARFDGVDDRLSGIPLNRPDELALLVLPTLFPIDYSGITSRGAQMWVYPESSQIGTGVQTILFDSQMMGGPQITADGKWTQAHSQRTADEFNGLAAVPGDVAVVGDTWHHVMQHVYNFGDPNAPRLVSGGGGTNHLAIVYVNGVAVSANAGSIPTGFDLTAQGFSGELIVGAEDDGQGDFKNHFAGVIDNLEMYVFGSNNSQDFGTFDLFADNEWIATEIANTVPGGVLVPGDVNKDGQVDQDDVTAFVAGWKSRNVLMGGNSTLTVGDWNTWGLGDMNHDGVTNLADAFILHEALVAATGAGLNFALLSGAQVPEPSAVALVALGVVSMTFVRKRG